MSTWDTTEIKPQDGPQTAAVKSTVDILIYGGAAGGGKTAALIIKPLYWISNPDFRGAIFRRESVHLTIPDGLIDETYKVYPRLGAKFSKKYNRWTFPSGATIDFLHCENEKDLADKYQGLQAAWIGVDEATTLTKSMLLFLKSRLRTGSTSRIPQQLMLTCNPEHGHCIGDWLQKGGYLDEGGYPIPEMSGVIRYFVIGQNEATGAEDLEFAADPSEFGSKESIAERFTFIPSNVTDNKILMISQPDYEKKKLGNASVFMVERYKKGCWKAIADGEKMIRQSWFQTIYGTEIPPFFESIVRAWDLALTADGDYTAGVLMGRYQKTLFVLDVSRFKMTPGNRNAEMLRVMQRDRAMYPTVQMAIEQFSGPGGLEAAYHTGKFFTQFMPRIMQVTSTKEMRIKPFAEELEAGRVRLLYGAWNTDYKSELCAFPNKKVKDDQVDATSLAEQFLREQNPGSMSAEFAQTLGVRPLAPGMAVPFRPVAFVNATYEDGNHAESSDRRTRRWRF